MRAIVAALALLCVAGGARAVGSNGVKDWAAACDNIGACAAFGFSPEDSDADAYLVVKRAAGPEAAPTVVVAFDPGDAQPAAIWRLTLDGHPIAGVGPLHAAGSDNGARAKLAGAEAVALIDALKNGKTLELSAGGKPLAMVSLAGSAAVLLWVDDQQGRVGTVTALVKKGPRPASLVPPPKPAPLILAAPRVSQAGLPKQAPRSMTKGDSECDLDPSLIPTPDDVVARLAPGVVLWGPECTTGAYNVINVFFIGDEHGGHLKPAAFAGAPGADANHDLMNVTYDAATRVLSSLAKIRGVGDCGEATSWVWTGKAFELSRESALEPCRGVSPDDWPTLFVARTR